MAATKPPFSPECSRRGWVVGINKDDKKTAGMDIPRFLCLKEGSSINNQIGKKENKPIWQKEAGMRLLDKKKKVVVDPGALVKITEGLKAQGCSIVVTIGSWDMLHVGHVRYLMKAKEQGDILIVGTDSDRAIKLYKDPSRPMVCEAERLEMLSYLECVDFTILVDDVSEEGKWQYDLIKMIRADVFVTVEGSYPDEQIEDIKKYCAEVKTLPRQAETSTSNIIHKVMKEFLGPLINFLKEKGLV